MFDDDFDDFEEEYTISSVEKNFIELQKNYFYLSLEEKEVLKTKLINVLREHVVYMQYVNLELRNDINFILDLIKSREALVSRIRLTNTKKHFYQDSLMYGFAHILRFSSDTLKDNKLLVSKVVTFCGYSLHYASDRLKNDKEIVLLAIRNKKDALEYASNDLKKNKDFILYLSENNLVDFRYVSKRLLNDRTFIREVIKSSPYVLKYISSNLKSDKQFILDMICLNNECKDYIFTN